MKKVLILIVCFIITAWAQDIIMMKNGESINGFVYEVGNNIIYKTDTLSRVAYSISRNEVRTIFFEDGKKWIVNNSSPIIAISNNDKSITEIEYLRIKKNSLAASTVIFGLTAFTMGFIGGYNGEPAPIIIGIGFDVAFMITLPCAIVSSVRYRNAKSQ